MDFCFPTESYFVVELVAFATPNFASAAHQSIIYTRFCQP